ncbi:MAG: ferritin [Thermoplasmata archaeon]|nr:MAG: ferritin [Thermoplasmata archaeon]
MKIFRCRICGDPYLGEEIPTNCPFCGAPSKYIIPAKDWVEPEIETLSEVSKKNLEAALQLEIENTSFYMCASQMTEKPEGKQLFRALSKIEREHAYLISEMLFKPKPVIELDKLACYPTYQENLKDAHHREERAIKLYGQFFKEAKEPHVQEVFGALTLIESDHLKLANERIRI